MFEFTFKAIYIGTVSYLTWKDLIITASDANTSGFWLPCQAAMD